MNIKKGTVRLAILAILVAILLLMMFTPVGYFKYGFVEVTFYALPIAIGAVLLGPQGGAVLGLVFGITSFIQCFTGSPLGALLVSINPFLTALLCFVPRILMGLFTGFLFKRFSRKEHVNIAGFILTPLCTALTNTLLFTGMFALLFYPTLSSLASESGQGIMAFIAVNFLLNGTIEAAVCTIIGTPLCKAMFAVGKKIGLVDAKN